MERGRDGEMRERERDERGIDRDRVKGRVGERGEMERWREGEGESGRERGERRDEKEGEGER